MSEKKSIPLAVVNQVFFPKVHFAFTKLSEELILALKEASSSSDNEFIVTTISGHNGELSSNYHEIGVLCKLIKFEQLDLNRFNVQFDSLTRFQITSITKNDSGVLLCDGITHEIKDLDIKDAELIRIHEELKKCLYSYSVEESPMIFKELDNLEKKYGEINSEILLSYAFTLVTGNISFKQNILSVLDVKELYKLFLNYFKPELEKIKLEKANKKIKNDINQKTNKNLEKAQKEFLLKEQIKTIKKELGEDEGEDDNSQYLAFMKKYEKLKLTKEADEKISRDLKRFNKMNSASGEYQVLENYLNTVLNYPWNKNSEKKFNLQEAKAVLSSEHFGIDHVKKRVIEYLSSIQFTKDMPAQILCLYGPPGVGKTSICKSIAKSLGREYVRISLGGVSDEAEIRGHRRTYLGAMPGKIVQAIIQAKTSNPVIVLDEIDKVGKNSQKGSVEASLLEVLDPEQNKSFQDHYLGLGIDLSKIIFISTANDIGQITGPLRDRMEMIELHSYTLQEKVQIAESFLISQEKKSHGLEKYNIVFEKNAIESIVLNYTMESGVRNLRKKIASIFRQCAVKILEGTESILINQENIHEFLGDDIIAHEKAKEEMVPGIATGMAWTPYGGEIIFIEASKMKGSGNIKITGQLGDIMKESAEIALSYIRSNDLDKVNKFNEKTFDLHIHVPAGATPKDGPSAGVTLVTTMVSLLNDKKVKSKLAMTGEISLQGDVLPVGGIKEKIIAAYMSGITEVIIPEKNKKDINKLPNEIKENQNFKIYTVSKIQEVLDLAIEK